MNSRNVDKYFGSAAKIATCLIEHDLEEEIARGMSEVLRVSTMRNNEYQELGLFFGSWEFEEWLCSDLPYDEWRKSREGGALDIE